MPGAAHMIVERQMPAPLIVTLFRTMCPGIWNGPSGIHTVPPAPAAEIAALKAAVASVAPVGSAPLLVTEPEPDGCAGGPATLRKAATTLVSAAAASPPSPWHRNSHTTRPVH